VSGPTLGDDLGPRGRRIVTVASVVAGVLLLAVLAVGLRRFADNGQLDGERWAPLTEWAVWRFLLGGLVNTVKAAVVAMALSLVIGLLMCLGRLARNGPVRWLAGAYVELFRGFPLLLLILFSVFGLRSQGFDISTYTGLVLALALYNSAVLAEIFRAGVLSLDRGQGEAASALGLGYWQSMGLVILPQALRRMVPAIVSQVVVLLKDTSLGFFVQYEELLRRGQTSGQFDQNLLQALIAVAGLYIAVNMVLSQIARRLEVRQRRRYGAGGVQVGGVEDLAVLDASGDSDMAAAVAEERVVSGGAGRGAPGA
jgi:glutamate transport system permease protein